MVGITVPDNYKAIIMKSQVTDGSDILGDEIMAPVLRYTTYEKFEDAIEAAVANLEVHGGAGHSSAIWSNNPERIEQAALRIPVGRFHINQPTRGKGERAARNCRHRLRCLGRQQHLREPAVLSSDGLHPGDGLRSQPAPF